MKKSRILIPNLIATLSLPFIALVSCGNQQGEEKFKVSKCMMDDKRNASISLLWFPEDHSVLFESNSFKFSYNRGRDFATITPLSTNDNSILLKMVFEKDVTKNIIDGVLSFRFHDETIDVSGNTSIRQIYIDECLHDTSFVDCEWSKIGEACNKLESGEWTTNDFLHEFYIDGDLTTEGVQPKNPRSLSDFAGQKRYVKINGNDHEVVVLGCQEDFTDSTAKYPLALTFQFNNLISDTNGNGLIIEWKKTFDYPSNGNYWDSILLNALNSTQNDVTWWDFEDQRSDITKSVYQMLIDENSGFSSLIKDVYRGVNVYSPSSTKIPPYELKSQTTKLFAPNLGNLFSKDGITNTGKFCIPTGNQCRKLYCLEGHQYTYYAKSTNIDDTTIADDDQETKIAVYNHFDCLVRNAINLNPDDTFAQYWLSSPSLEFGSGAWSVDIEGGYMHRHDVIYPIAMAPCFCI